MRAIAGRRVAAAWGELELESEPPVDTAWIGIRPEHVRLARGADHGLAARIERITALGAVHELLCRLPDDTAVHVHTPWDRPVPAPGEPVRLHLPSPYLRLLPRHRTPAQPIADQPDGGAGTTAGDQPQGAEPGVS
ncbi:MAG: TOBE domain-containing protein [Gammaproteobacteria bacterium]